MKRFVRRDNEKHRPHAAVPERKGRCRPLGWETFAARGLAKAYHYGRRFGVARGQKARRVSTGPVGRYEELESPRSAHIIAGAAEGSSVPRQKKARRLWTPGQSKPLWLSSAARGAAAITTRARKEGSTGNGGADRRRRTGRQWGSVAVQAEAHPDGQRGRQTDVPGMVASLWNRSSRFAVGIREGSAMDRQTLVEMMIAVGVSAAPAAIATAVMLFAR